MAVTIPKWYNEELTPYGYYHMTPYGDKVVPTQMSPSDYAIYRNPEAVPATTSIDWMSSPDFYAPAYDYENDIFTPPPTPVPELRPNDYPIEDVLANIGGDVVIPPQQDMQIPEPVGGNKPLIPTQPPTPPGPPVAKRWDQLTSEEQYAISHNMQQQPEDSLLPDGYHWELDTSTKTWVMAKDTGPVIDPGEDIDTSVPSNVWEGFDYQLNQWREIMADALSKLDLNFDDQTAILDALTSKILLYEQPNLTQAYKDMDELIAAIEAAGSTKGYYNENGEYVPSDIEKTRSKLETGFEDEAFDFVARGYGFKTAQEYFDWQVEMRGFTREDMVGLTAEEKAAYDKIARMDMAEYERQAQAQMEAVFANTGSAIQYMAAADEANQQMVDIRAQYQAAQTEQNAMLQMQELDQKMQQYGTMVQQGQMSAAQYMDTRQRGYETILNGYLQEMQIQVASLTAALEGVQGYATLQLTEAENDLAALNTQIDQVYRSIMVQSGINQSILDAVDQAYATSMKPMMDAITSLLAQENLSAQDEQLAFQYEALAIEEMNNYLQFGVGIADAAVNLVDALNPFKPKK